MSLLDLAVTLPATILTAQAAANAGEPIPHGTREAIQGFVYGHAIEARPRLRMSESLMVAESILRKLTQPDCLACRGAGCWSCRHTGRFLFPPLDAPPDVARFGDAMLALIEARLSGALRAADVVFEGERNGEPQTSD